MTVSGESMDAAWGTGYTMADVLEDRMSSHAASLDVSTPGDVTEAELMDALDPLIRPTVGNVTINRQPICRCVCANQNRAYATFNFHTIMDAEAARKTASITVRGEVKKFQRSSRPYDNVLLVGVMDDFPVDELLALFKLHSSATVTQLYKTSLLPNLLVLHTATRGQACELQRALHGASFRDTPLFVGCQRPGFQPFIDITTLQPDVPSALFKAGETAEAQARAESVARSKARAEYHRKHRIDSVTGEPILSMDD